MSQWPVSLISATEFLSAVSGAKDERLTTEALEGKVMLLEQLRHCIGEQPQLWTPVCPSIVKQCLHSLSFLLSSSSSTTSSSSSSTTTSSSSCSSSIDFESQEEDPTSQAFRRLAVAQLSLAHRAFSHAPPPDPSLRAAAFAVLADFSRRYCQSGAHIDVALQGLVLLTHDGKEIAPFEREVVALVLEWLACAPSTGGKSGDCRDCILRLVQQVISFNFALLQLLHVLSLVRVVFQLILDSIAHMPDASAAPEQHSPAEASKSGGGIGAASEQQKLLRADRRRKRRRSLATCRRCLAQECFVTLDYILRFGFFPSSLLDGLLNVLCRGLNVVDLEVQTFALADNIFSSAFAPSAARLLCAHLSSPEPALFDLTEAAHKDNWCRSAVFLLSHFCLDAQNNGPAIFLAANFLVPCLGVVEHPDLPLAVFEIALSVFRLLQKHGPTLSVEWDLMLSLVLGLGGYLDHPMLDISSPRSLSALLCRILQLLKTTSASNLFLASHPKFLACNDAYFRLVVQPHRLQPRVLRSASEGGIIRERSRSKSQPEVIAQQSLRLASEPDLSSPFSLASLSAELIAFKASFVKPHVEDWIGQLEGLLVHYWTPLTHSLICSTVRQLYLKYRAIHATAIEAVIISRLLSAWSLPGTSEEQEASSSSSGASSVLEASTPQSLATMAADLEFLRLIETLACYTHDAAHLVRFLEAVSSDVRILKRIWSQRFKHLGGQHGLFVYKHLVQCSIHQDTEVRLSAARCLAKFGVVKLPGSRRYSVSYGGRILPNSRLYWVRQEHSSNFRLLPFDILFNTAVKQIRVEHDPHVFALLQFGVMTFLHNRYAMATGSIVRVAELSATLQPRFLRLITTAMGYKVTLARENQEAIIRYLLQTKFPDSKMAALHSLCCAVVEMPQAARTLFQPLLNMLLQLVPKSSSKARAAVAIVVATVETGVAQSTSFPLFIDLLLRMVNPRHFSAPTLNAAYRAIASIFFKVEPSRRSSLLASLSGSLAKHVEMGCPFALATLDLLSFHTPLDPTRKEPFPNLPILLTVEETGVPMDVQSATTISPLSVSALFSATATAASSPSSSASSTAPLSPLSSPFPTLT
ncbi:MAG: DUF3384 domain-containing protein, partial [archaeon]|nr:DUF3384 domain-containing protein [archaeon]